MSVALPECPPELRPRVESLRRQYPNNDQFLQAYRHLYAQWSVQKGARNSPGPAQSSRRSEVGRPGPGRPPNPPPSSSHVHTPSVRGQNAPTPNQRLLPPPHPLSKRSDPPPPFTPLSRQAYQALLTTYPSRLRLGLASLMQPLNAINATPATTSNPSSGSVFNRDATVLGKRQRQQINYAEFETYDDLEEESSSSAGGDYDDSGPASRGSQRATRVQPSRSAAASAPGTSGTITPDKKAAAPVRTYLGDLAPGNLITVEPARRTRHLYPSEAELAKSAATRPILVPIRVEFDTDTHRIRDCFLWNLNEKFVTPESFAQTFCDDVGLASSYRDQIASSIRSQIDELTGVAEVPLLNDEQVANSVETDLRVVINLDVQVQTLHLVDRLEWDLTSKLSPELFARQMASELGLTPEAVPLISHSIHEELLRAKKDCLEQGLVGVESTFIGGRERGAKRLEGIWRDLHDVEEWGPRVVNLTPGEIEKVETERERHTRRVRRDQIPRQNVQGTRLNRRR